MQAVGGHPRNHHHTVPPRLGDRPILQEVHNLHAEVDPRRRARAWAGGHPHSPPLRQGDRPILPGAHNLHEKVDPRRRAHSLVAPPPLRDWIEASTAFENPVFSVVDDSTPGVWNFAEEVGAATHIDWREEGLIRAWVCAYTHLLLLVPFTLVRLV